MIKRDEYTGLDTWPRKRPNAIVVQRDAEGRTFAMSLDGRRLLRIPGQLVINEKVVRETVFEYDTERSA